MVSLKSPEVLFSNLLAVGLQFYHAAKILLETTFDVTFTDMRQYSQHISVRLFICFQITPNPSSPMSSRTQECFVGYPFQISTMDAGSMLLTYWH